MKTHTDQMPLLLLWFQRKETEKNLASIQWWQRD